MKRSHFMGIINVMLLMLYIVILTRIQTTSLFLPLCIVFVGTQLMLWIPYFTMRNIEARESTRKY